MWRFGKYRGSLKCLKEPAEADLETLVFAVKFPVVLYGFRFRENNMGA